MIFIETRLRCIIIVDILYYVVALTFEVEVMLIIVFVLVVAVFFVL